MRHNSARELEGQEKIEDPGRIPWGKTNNASNKLLAANAKEKQNDLLAAKSENNNLQLNGTKQNCESNGGKKWRPPRRCAGLSRLDDIAERVFREGLAPRIREARPSRGDVIEMRMYTVSSC